ncbi:MAG: exo-alpha-sialidase, partial [Gammaproteobacteria bacterium]|nr:exo-alpha-sialidase [Gammaproteobacteria bacterium]
MSKKKSIKGAKAGKRQTSKLLQPGGPGKKDLKIKKPSRVSTHKHRSEWFQDRATWPFREPPVLKLETERRRAMRVATVPGKARWENVGPSNIGGRVTCVTVHPDSPDDIIIGAAGGGLWSSKDAGRNWKCLWHNRDLNIGSLARDPASPDVVYCGTGEANLSADSYPGIGIYRSTNNGRTWQRWATSKKTGIPTRIGTIAVDPFNRRRVLLGGVSASDSFAAGLFYSDDMGKTWKRHSFISTNNYWCHSIVFHPRRKGVVFATITERGWKNGIWRSNDSGKTWEQLADGLPDSSLTDFNRTSLAIAPSRPDTIYAIAARGFDAVLGVFRSDDMGATWRNIAGKHFKDEVQMSYGSAIAVHPTDPEFVICGGVDLHVTKNGGASWTQVSRWDARRGASRYAHADHHALVMPAAAPGRIYDGNDGGLDVSEDNGSKWENRSDGLAITMYYDLDVATSNSNYFGGGAQDNGTLITVSGEHDNHFELLGGDGGWMIFHPDNENHVYASYQFLNIYRIIGSSYTDISPPASESEKYSVWMAFTAMNPDDPDELFTGSKRVWRTRNRGNSWKAVSSYLDNSPIYAIEVAEAATNQIYVGTTNGGFFRSLDSGDSWSANLASAELPGKIITRIESSPDDGNLLYATIGGFNNAHVFQSMDGGLTWKDIDRGKLPDVPHNAVVVQSDNPDRVYVANDVGVFASMNRGKSWQRLTRNLPNVPVVDLVYHQGDGTLTAAT